TGVHRVPFQCSISALVPCLPLNSPTAQTSRADTAATPRSTLLRPGGVNGDTDQAEPFQCSIRPRSPPPSSVRPTAQTSLTETADTASSRFRVRPGFRLVWVVQFAPSQCSISTWSGPRPALKPTAHALHGGSTVTPLSWLTTEPGIGGPPVQVWQPAGGTAGAGITR